MGQTPILYTATCHHEHGVASETTALATSIYAKQPYNNLWRSIMRSFLPQICVALEAVVLKTP